MYTSREDHVIGICSQYWRLHIRQLVATCDGYDIPDADAGHFQIICLKPGFVHYVHEVMDGLMKRTRGWKGITTDLARCLRVCHSTARGCKYLGPSQIREFPDA